MNRKTSSSIRNLQEATKIGYKHKISQIIINKTKKRRRYYAITNKSLDKGVGSIRYVNVLTLSLPRILSAAFAESVGSRANL